ncbi:hypothetical protein [Crocosphaera chwakensis]|nr:hypothetical protein [Crocosphaera chwakensis]
MVSIVLWFAKICRNPLFDPSDSELKSPNPGYLRALAWLRNGQ